MIAARLLLAAAVFAIVSASAAAQPAPAAKGVPAKAALDPALFPFFPLQSAWVVDRGVPPGPGVGIGDGAVFVGFTNGDLAAYDVASGQLRWTRQLEAKRPIIVDGSRLFVTGDKVVDALRTSDATSEWRTPLPAAVVAGPVVRGGWLLFALDNGSVTALRTDTGAAVWTMALGAPASVAPVVEGDRFYAATAGGTLHARTIADGAPLWQAALDGDVTALAAVEGHVFVATSGRWLYDLDAGRGRVRWRFRIQGAAIGLTVDEDRVIAVTLDQAVRSFKIGSGAQAWRQELSFRPAGGPIVVGTTVLVTGFAPTLRLLDRRTGADQGLYAVPFPDPSLAKLETLASGPLVARRATVFEDVVVLITQQGMLNGARRGFDPPVAIITALPGTPLTVPAPPPGMPDPPPAATAPATPPTAPAGTPTRTPPAPPGR